MSEFNESAGKTYYQLLGIANDADDSAIKEAYNEEYRKFLTAKDQTRWLLISEGWEVLKDKDRKASYDRQLKARNREEGTPALKVIRRLDEHYVYKRVKRGASFTETIVVKNDSNGELKGKIFSDAEWLVPDSADIAAKHEQTLDIVILTSNIPANCHDVRGTVTIDTNGSLPYSIPFRVILEDLEIATGTFRKTYVPLAVACAGFITSFSGSALPLALIGAVFAGAVFYATARFIVTASLKNGLNLFKPSPLFIQGLAGSAAILTMLFHYGFNPMTKQEVGAMPLPADNPPVAAATAPLQAPPEAEKKPVSEESNPATGAPASEAIALSGSVIGPDSKPVDPKLAGISSSTVNPGATSRKNTRPASKGVPRKKNRKPETSSFAPPSRDAL